MAWYRCGGGGKMKNVLGYCSGKRSANGTSAETSFEVEKGKQYYINMTCVHGYGDLDYAYYTYSAMSVTQEVGELTAIEENAVIGSTSSALGSTNHTNIRRSTYILKATQNGIVTLSSGAINSVSNTYSQTFCFEASVCSV